MIKKSQRDLIYANPDMFVGPDWKGRKWDNKALEKFLILLIQYAVDSSTMNECNVLKVWIKSKNEIVIEDNGIGLPITPHLEPPHTQALVKALTWYIPTGMPTTPFFNEYGFLGSFARVLNILSISLRIDTVYQGQSYTVSCSWGKIIEPLRKQTDDILSQGTRISFKPDPEIFPSPVFNEESLKSELDKLASKFPSVIFELSAGDMD
ncbi:hypothetical protein G4Y79_22735 [Phototrophicus methaneseepsis]|uniref:DNA topoisomerase (ATP-hydrolyzing) n=1 Tax=Phototrophicus methaneseepsis TaxID=2710758 RepID=A0A7S8IF25_9CHLR|nr:hypothetical protein [Phototrophicus methaneseepsis]QPC82468.1 hypothetical protein G4Y79_22735 [Phototrophicus methaneseepsis]